MCRPSKIDGRSLCRPSKIDDRCEIMLLYILAQNIDSIVVCQLRRGFALQCFHLYSNNTINFGSINNNNNSESTEVQTLGVIRIQLKII